MVFNNRLAAAKTLAKELRPQPESIVVGIPTGGAIISRELARHHSMPDYLIITAKVRSPRTPELAIGAVMPDGEAIVDEAIVAASFLDRASVEQRVEEAAALVAERKEVYKDHVVTDDAITNRNVIIADDGVATGLTVNAALQYCKKLRAASITIATPVIASATKASLETIATVTALLAPADFLAVGQYYREFPHLSEDDVLQFLRDK